MEGPVPTVNGAGKGSDAGKGPCPGDFTRHSLISTVLRLPKIPKSILINHQAVFKE